jgi:hypothetical protein
MKGQARSSVGIMGFDTHMILEIVPVLLSRPVTSPPQNRTSRHFAGALGSSQGEPKSRHEMILGVKAEPLRGTVVARMEKPGCSWPRAW